MARIPDDPVRESNRRGMVTFATSGPNSRTTQFFINFVDNTNLDGMGFSPFGRVQPDSMAVVDQLHSGYTSRPAPFLRQSEPSPCHSEWSEAESRNLSGEGGERFSRRPPEADS